MKIVKTTLTTVALLSLSGLAVWQQTQIRNLKVQMATLRGGAAEVASLREESDRLAKAQLKPEPPVAEPDLQELLRLRGEVGVLRRQVAGTANEAAKRQTYLLDAAKQSEELLLATLNVPQQVAKSADALDAETVNAYLPYFKAKQEREELERFEAVMDAKRRLAANNAGADTTAGSGK